MPNDNLPHQPSFPTQPSDRRQGDIQQPAPASVPAEPSEVKPSYPGSYPGNPADPGPATDTP